MIARHEVPGSPAVPGYTYGSPDLPRSPVSRAELEQIQAAVMFTPEDADQLRRMGELLAAANRIEKLLDVWYGFVGSHPHLVHFFAGPDGRPDADYLARVRARFGQWVRDTCRAEFDQTWLDYQQEIGLRHHRTKKNVTDGVASVTHIPWRYLAAFIHPITATVRPFLEEAGQPRDAVDRMMAAWHKAVVLSVILWSHPYVREGDF